MQLNPYLVFNGNCEQAFKFYEQVLSGRIKAMMTHEGTPMEAKTPPEWRKKIMHARLTVGDQVLMGSDAPPEHFHKPQGSSVSLGTDKLAPAERIFHTLEEDGKVQMPFQKTFWAEGFGMVTDQFGTPWIINCDKEA